MPLCVAAIVTLVTVAHAVRARRSAAVARRVVCLLIAVGVVVGATLLWRRLQRARMRGEAGARLYAAVTGPSYGSASAPGSGRSGAVT